MEQVPLPVQTIRAAYAELGRSVHIALRTQTGDAARLGVQRLDCLRILALTAQVSINCCWFVTLPSDLFYSMLRSSRLMNVLPLKAAFGP
jgi:hypothetical protein